MKKATTHAQKQRAIRGGRSPCDAAYDRRRRRDPKLAFAKKIRDSGRWQSLRAKKRRADPLCEPCIGKGVTVEATSVDHIQSLQDRPDLAYSWSNLMSLCEPCHAKKSAAERRGS